MRMPRFILLIPILLFISSTPVSSEVICQSQDGYRVERRYVKLSEGQMTVTGLCKYFENLGDIKGELYVIAVSDQEYYRRLADPGMVIAPHREVLSQIEIQAPLAYYFQIGSSRFLQAILPDGSVTWLNLQNGNPLNRSFGKMRLKFAGHGFVSHQGEFSCDSANHKIVFYTDELGNKTEIMEAIEYYDNLFREPFLSLQIYDDLAWAITDETIRYPGLEFINSRNLPRGDLEGSVSFFRDIFWGRSLKIYKNSEIIFEKNW